MTPSILKQLFEVNNRLFINGINRSSIYYYYYCINFFKAHPSTKRKAGKFTLRGGIKFTEAKNCAIVYLGISYVIVKT